MLEYTVTSLVEGLTDKVLDGLHNKILVIINTNDIVKDGLGHEDFVLLLLRLVKVWDLVHLTQLADVLEELISCACSLGFEERLPEHHGICVFKGVNDVLHKVVVENVLEVNRVQLVSPWMEYLKALMVHVLLPEAFNVLADEFKVSLVGLDWV